MNARDYLIAIYIDFRNNYLTEEKWAEHNGLTDEEGRAMLALARQVASHDYPDA